MKDHKDLDVWRESIELVTSVYALTSSFPRDEMFGLVNQMRRAAVSIPSNIAEGAARQGEREFIHFLHISLGSAAELETQVIIAGKLNYLGAADQVLKKVETVRKMLHGLIRHYRTKV